MMYPQADILHIGYPKAASTFIQRYLESHPQVTIDHNRVAPLLGPESHFDHPVVVEKPSRDKIHVSREESIAESVCVIGDVETWQRNSYVPGAWDQVKNDIIIDPGEAASRLHRIYPRAKVLILIREQADWMQSIYKYVISQLPATQRSFPEYCSTPSGIVLLEAGHFDRTISAYADTFGSQRVSVMRFEDIVSAPRRFAAELCAFLGVSEHPLPQRRENESHAQIARILRYIPILDRLPRSVKDAIKPQAARLLPGARGMILSTRYVRMLRGIYAASNQRTEKLLNQLSNAAH